ncbi:MAG: hypothetical protein DMG21_12005 [Acidobacteria bacterium]|nr:MAG: hypothetical protein DMG21_12005 [Acidobacteriota bacterium]
MARSRRLLGKNSNRGNDMDRLGGLEDTSSPKRHPSHPRRPAALTVGLIGAWVLIGPWHSLLAQKQPEAAKGPSVAWKLGPQPASEGYVGTDRCRSCHKAEVVEFGKTVHADLKSEKNHTAMDCETCHGPGKEHSDAMEAAEGDDAKTAAGLKEHPIFAFHGTPVENASRCLSCHITSKEQSFFNQSAHAVHGLACGECHTTHLVDEVKDLSRGNLTYPQAYFFQVPKLEDETRWLHNNLLKQAEPALCFTCHPTVQAQFALPEHHRVPEGFMNCSDCHTPHGSMNLASLNKPNFEACVTCHVEKRGPFVFEHPASRVEGCVACHTPHGSVNNFMLVRRQGKLLCLQCHTGFHSQAGVPHGRLGFQTSGECTRCHVSVHGSNFDVNFLR